MAKPNKKRDTLESQLGRPKKGALSTYPQKLRNLIFKIRDNHEGWGANTILVELVEEHGYQKDELPGLDAVNRFIKQNGFVKERIPSGKMPIGQCKGKGKVKHFHDLWEMDAEGAVAVSGLGYISNINIKDSKSKAHCMAFPVHVKGQMSQPKTDSYLWALRLAFEQWGLPKAIQVDRDSVFIDNTSKSAFPSRMHLLLIGLGVKLCFINLAPPLKQAIVERSHQTLNKQTIKGQHYDNWKKLFQFTNKRRKRMNEKLPNRSLGGRAPLEMFPAAKHSGRHYEIAQEEQLIQMSKIYKYLSKCCWYRKVSKARTLSLSGKIYYLKNAQPNEQVQIKFCNRSKKLIFRNAKELFIAKLPIKDFLIHDIMGASTKDLISTKKRLFRLKDFPL